MQRYSVYNKYYLTGNLSIFRSNGNLNLSFLHVSASCTIQTYLRILEDIILTKFSSI